MKRVLPSDLDCVRCKLVAVDLGLRALPCFGLARRGGRYPGWAHDVAVAAARRLRCDARSTRAAAVPPSAALDAPRTSRRPRRSDACGAGLPLAALRFSPPHKSPTPGTAYRAVALVVFDDACHGDAGKAVVGCAPAATYAAPSRRARTQAVHWTACAWRAAGPQGPARPARPERVAARAQRALRALTRGDCPSATTAGSEASFAAGHAIEQRREPLAQRGAAAFERRCIPGRGFATRASRRCARVPPPRHSGR
ncbi:MAG: hypothetical protein LKCHEGNO_02745 [Burkholderiaceae bacterium]|nr:hypothetical protein [Burkholderiaceae bacterium]